MFHNQNLSIRLILLHHSPPIFNPSDREVTLDTKYVMPVMRESPIEVLFYDDWRRQ